MMKKFLVLLGMASVSCGSSAFALDNYDLTNLSGLSNSIVENLLKTTSLGVDHRPMMPATPLGLAIGIDVGVTVGAISVPSEFKNALSVATGQAEGSIPSVLPVPQLSIRKGLPLGLDLGFSYASSRMVGQAASLFNVYGGDAQWAFVSGSGAMPAVSARLGFSSSTLWFMKTTTWGLDLIASKNLYVIDPYVGFGLKRWSGSLELQPVQELPVSVSGSASGFNPHVFVGLPLKLMAMHLTGEVDYNFNGITSYGAKIAFNF